MPAIKPSLEQEQVLSLLREHFADPIVNLSPLEGCQVAQTFAFTVNGQDYVLRFITDRMGATFEKEAYLQRRLAPRIPVPRIIHADHFQELYYLPMDFRQGHDPTLLGRIRAGRPRAH